MLYIIALLIIIAVSIDWIWRYQIRKRRTKHHPKWHEFKKIELLLHNIYQSTIPTNISLQDRNELQLNDDAFTYGEIEFLPFLILLDEINPKSGEVFYDLGSGAGKAVFAAGLSYDLHKACGIEFLPGLCAFATSRIDKAKSLLQHQNDQIMIHRLSSIQFIQGDLLNHDYADADIIYISATCFGYSLWEKIIAKLTTLKVGSRIIITTKKIEHEQFELIKESNRLMSWGLNSVFIYRKIK